MCGITGLINWGDSQTLAQMTNIQAHRGPDDSGLWETQLPNGGWVGLGSRRLAILDLSPAGHMPMSTPDGKLTIVYNGEVYNYPQLRRELETKGYQFRSGSDTEAVLYMYREYGPEFVGRLNGIFAMAIWDQARQQLFLARDHFGIKPLYYCHQGNRLAFASEMKALLELPDVPRRMSLSALHRYLTFLWVPEPLTLFEEIIKVPAGHYAIFRDGQLSVTEYWDLRFPDAGYDYGVGKRDSSLSLGMTSRRDSSTSLGMTSRRDSSLSLGMTSRRDSSTSLGMTSKGGMTSLATELRERFIGTVKGQMLSDVPLGAFLSAGLDSSSIVAAMAQSSEQAIRTFTIAFPDKYRQGEVTLDDTAVARRTAEHFGCHHTEIMVEPDVVELLPKLVWHMDEPVADPAIITAYLVNREARKDVTVLLSGVGGDELFAGYRKHQAHYLAQHYRRLPHLVRQRLVEPAISALPAFRGTPLKGYVRLAKKMARSGSLPPRERFVMDSVYLTDAQKEGLYSDPIRSQMNGLQAHAQHFALFDQVADADFLNQMLYLDTKAFMASLNLNYNDKMSMASSVEVRVPFLDWELAEWVAWNVPPHLKLHQGTTKYILREAMRPLLPPEVLTQKKAGFGAPADYWLANELREMVDDLLSERQIKKRGFFNPAAVHRLIEEQRSGKEDWSMQIWQFLTLELWMQAFLD